VGYVWFRSLPELGLARFNSEMTRLLAATAVLFAIACGAAAPSPVGNPLTVDELKFKVIDAVGAPVYCDPDFYPVARQGGEEANAISNYPAIRAQSALYAALIAHEHLPPGDLDDAQKLMLYRAYKLLNALTLAQSGSDYAFEFRAQNQSKTSIELVKGTVRIDGVVNVTSRAAS
jgi:hypothetical protein